MAEEVDTNPPTGTYSINDFNSYCNSFSINIANLEQATEYNVLNNTVKLSDDPVSVDQPLVNIKQVLSTPDQLSVEFYNKNNTIIATATLSNGQLNITSVNMDECFIATAAYGSKFKPSVVLLRNFRDSFLLTNPLGTRLVQSYYRNSPPIAYFIANRGYLKAFVRLVLVPFIAMAYLCFHPLLLLLVVLLITLLAFSVWNRCLFKWRRSVSLLLLISLSLSIINFPIPRQVLAVTSSAEENITQESVYQACSFSGTLTINDVSDDSIRIGKDIYSGDSKYYDLAHLLASLKYGGNNCYVKKIGFWYNIQSLTNENIGNPEKAEKHYLVTGWNLRYWYKTDIDISEVEDNSPPLLIQASQDISTDQFILQINEPVLLPDSSVSVQLVRNDNNEAHVGQIIGFADNSRTRISVKTDSELSNGIWTVKIYSIKDEAGNISTLQIANLEVYKLIDPDTDTDTDGLSNSFESLLGTDYTKSDTDGDGLEDGFEYIKSLTDPLIIDTDNNGTNDDQEDADEDLLTNIREQGLGTDPSDIDTDSDTLSDYAEIETYNTNPLNVDTDGDGLNDGDEITLGLDPTKLSTDGVTLDGERTFSQTLSADNFDGELVDDDAVIIPSLFGNVNGTIDSNITVEVADTDAFDDNRAVIGNVINIDSDYEGSSLILSYDASKIVSEYDEDYAKDLVICQVGGENGLTPLTTTYDRGKISANIPDRGEYLVLNVDEFLRMFGIDVMASITSESVLETFSTPISGPRLQMSLNEEEPKTFDNNVTYEPENYTPSMENAIPKITAFNAVSRAVLESAMGVADIAFVIDTTGSMGDEIYNVQENVKSFADQLVNVYNVNANFALVDFRDIVEDGNGSTYIRKNGVSNWYSNVSAFKQAVEGMSADGGGDDPECDVDALEMSRQLDWRTTASKFIILVTDAPYKVDNNYGIESMEKEISLLVNDGIVVSVITSSSFESTYQDLYTQTGGIIANIYGSFGTTLLALADKIGDVTSKGTWIILDDFQQVRLNDPADDPDEDTDDDGIMDYSELDSKKTVKLDLFIQFLCFSKGVNPDLYIGKDSIEVWSYKSNPTREDTENDGILDKEDTAPKKKGLAGGIIGKLYLVSCYNSEDAAWTSGHAFFAYNTYVNDTLNFKNLAVGWSKIDSSREWSSDNVLRDVPPVKEYQIKRGQYLTLGNGALGAEGLCGGGGDANGVSYNMEVYKHLTPSFGYSYLKNTYIAMEMTQDKYDDMIAHLSEDGVNKWTYTHNCTTVASETWNLISDTKVDATSWSFMLNTVATPKGLKNNLRTISGHKEDFALADALKE
ncbi:CFI-box-CTERM domain-containing protein [Bacteroides sp.]|uniref:vWA domain-containing protein n=1 Tax=Bacteroides sp. TaxID=29523 RepID=UPI002624366C|nr:CFI-box-CTERM domain-containing protein [Bacteroides sp.]MDD3040810.1 VWA domain-containing protein [Bacteroides sp.]